MSVYNLTSHGYSPNVASVPPTMNGEISLDLPHTLYTVQINNNSSITQDNKIEKPKIRRRTQCLLKTAVVYGVFLPFLNIDISYTCQYADLSWNKNSVSTILDVIRYQTESDTGINGKCLCFTQTFVHSSRPTTNFQVCIYRLRSSFEISFL